MSHECDLITNFIFMLTKLFQLNFLEKFGNPTNVSDYSIEFDDSELKFANGERYMLWESTKTFPTATLQLYGDSAEPHVPDGFTTAIEFEVTEDGTQKDPVSISRKPNKLYDSGSLNDLDKDNSTFHIA